MTNGARVVRQKLLGGIKAHAGTAIGVGITLVLTGVLAIAAPFLAGVSVMLMIGALMLAGGIALCLLAIRVGAFGPGFPLLLMGVLMMLVGLFVVARPVVALASMTLFLATYLIISGIIEVFAAFGARPEQGWGWMAASAVVTLLLGITLWRQFPLSGVWAVGTLFGIKLLLTGVSVISMGMAVRRGVLRIEAVTKP